MSRPAPGMPFISVPLDASSDVPLYQQLYERLRGVILSGQLAPGTRVPSTRLLGETLSISRNTVLTAFDQLQAEGYIEGRQTGGTYVASVLPDPLLHLGTPPSVHPASRRPREQGERDRPAHHATWYRPDTARIVQSHREGSILWHAPTAFSALPAADAFPYVLWERLTTQFWRTQGHELPWSSCPTGYYPLRAAITGYLGAARGVRCAPEQVIVVNGVAQATDLAARVLLSPGDAAWVEDPGHPQVAGALHSAGVRHAHVPVDAQGFDVARGLARCPEARLAVVSPGRHFPLGMAMSLARRVALLAWARQADAWVFEYDYDSVYRYRGRPLAALQCIDPDERVIYYGTFADTLFPDIEVAYLVVPPDLVDPFVVEHLNLGMYTALSTQAVLADFIAGGHFARHIRRMRRLYAERQAALVAVAARELNGLLHVQPADSGLQLMGWLPEGVDDREAAYRAAAHGVETAPLSLFTEDNPDRRGGLLLGYAGVNPRDMPAAARQLAVALRACVHMSSTPSGASHSRSEKKSEPSENQSMSNRAVDGAANAARRQAVPCISTLDDALWEKIKPLIPGVPHSVRRGRPRLPDRLAFEAIIYVLRQRIPWKALPREIAAPSTVHDRFQDWQRTGFFQVLQQTGLAAHDSLADVVWPEVDGNAYDAASEARQDGRVGQHGG